MWLPTIFMSSYCLLGVSFVLPNSLSHEDGEIHAVIAVGSDEDYRHQADACHAYHVLREHGVKEENIIQLNYDNIANDASARFPGTLYNHPNLTRNYYEGCKIDYRAEQVTVDNFLNALSGKPSSSGPVLNTTANDRVFVYFVDHGGPGYVNFPREELSAHQLNKTIAEMTENKKYKELVFYVEACFSGSVFENTAPYYKDLYVITAANDHEPSSATYWSEEVMEYLGDEFSVAWMEFSDANDLHMTTLQDEYENVKRRTTTSHAQQFGSKKIAEETIDEFQGGEGGNLLDREPIEFVAEQGTTDPALSRMQRLLETHTSNGNDQEAAKLHKEIDSLLTNRKIAEVDINGFIKKVVTTKELRELTSEHKPIKDYQCHHDVITYFSEHCYKLSDNPYIAKFMHKIISLCYAMTSDEIVGLLKSHWQERRNVKVL
ncbi:unnamed protein product [Bursaphelenchus xylophilus]|uniref:legumain n=1 Tax=Bursaphelenchus xylophilus TaxID=6326 RepID=A0A1I7SFY8_BURXY|nr:unnamed protein product [Bursaphelenchus xylophilus]CAG9104539.1 unnamed protein product [Bursaphelenchus xylophilus]